MQLEMTRHVMVWPVPIWQLITIGSPKTHSQRPYGSRPAWPGSDHSSCETLSTMSDAAPVLAFFGFIFIIVSLVIIIRRNNRTVIKSTSYVTQPPRVVISPQPAVIVHQIPSPQPQIFVQPPASPVYVTPQQSVPSSPYQQQPPPHHHHHQQPPAYQQHY